MRGLIVLSFDLPDDAEQQAAALAEAMTAVNPPALPHFAGQARVVQEPYASPLERYLDGSGPASAAPAPRPANRAERRHPRR